MEYSIVRAIYAFQSFRANGCDGIYMFGRMLLMLFQLPNRVLAASLIQDIGLSRALRKIVESCLQEGLNLSLTFILVVDST